MGCLGLRDHLQKNLQSWIKVVLASFAVVSCGGSSDSVTGPPPSVAVASVSVALGSGSLGVGATTQASATVRDASGNVLAGRAVVWTSSTLDMATVSSSGVITAVGVGSVTITATSEGRNGTATLVVTPGPPASITVTLGATSLAIGATTQATATVKDAANNVVTGQTVAWASSNTAVATIGATTAVVTAVAPGTALVSATIGAVIGTVSLTVVTPPPASGEQRSVAAGWLTTCALTPAGAAFCWGANRNGSVGNGQLGSTVPIPSPTAVLGGHQFKAIYVGNNTSDGTISCALTPDGHAYCWGSALLYASGGPGPLASPTLISSSVTFKKLSVGGTHSCGITGDQQLYCWGSNYYGELLTPVNYGQGSVVPLLALSGQSVKEVAAGYGFTCAIVTSGETVCAGVNHFNQIGPASGSVCNGFACTPTPTVLAGAPAFVRLTVGRQSACGLTSAGSAYCWGHNYAGQLGVGTSGNQSDMRSTPQPVIGGHAFSDLRAGTFSVCGLVAGAGTYCWGNLDGTPGGTPAAVAGSASLVTLSVGADQACGADNSGQLWCWGGNASGQLGDGTLTAHSAPAVVPQLTVGVP